MCVLQYLQGCIRQASEQARRGLSRPTRGIDQKSTDLVQQLLALLRRRFKGERRRSRRGSRTSVGPRLRFVQYGDNRRARSLDRLLARLKYFGQRVVSLAHQAK